MRWSRWLLVSFSLLLICECPVLGALAFRFVPSDRYLNETLRTDHGAPSSELRLQLATFVDEVLDGPWLPLYSDYSAGEAGGVGLAEWCFNRPGEYVRSLSEAATYLSPDQKVRVHAFLRELIQASPPTRQPYVPWRSGKARNIRPAPPVLWPDLNGLEKERLFFDESYSIWRYADAFGAWPETRQAFEDLRQLRVRLEERGDFTARYRPEDTGVLTQAQLQDRHYQFQVYESLLSGFQDNYGYHGAREARARMQNGQPVFFYVKTLSALLGYYRLAQHWSTPAEALWASNTFNQVAAATLQDKSAPFLWSDPSVCPEVGRLIREAAGAWLDRLATIPNVALLPAVDWDNHLVPGRGDYRVVNPFTWFHAWGGQGEGVRPRTVLGAFQANAWLFPSSPEQVIATLDLPWCRADLYYLIKLTTAIERSEGTHWENGGPR